MSMPTTDRRKSPLRLKPLLLVSVVVVLPVAWYCWVIPVTISEVPPDMLPPYWHLGVNVGEPWEKEVTPREIFMATGRFFGNGRHLRVMLYLVEHGTATEIYDLGVGQTSMNGVIGFFGQRLNIRIALGEVDTPQGHMTLLGEFGGRAGGGSGRPLIGHVTPVANQLLTGRIYTAKPRLVYVEGDQIPVAAWGTTLEEFVAQNPGRYLVVTAALE
jgi:hypothetical protein